MEIREHLLERIRYYREYKEKYVPNVTEREKEIYCTGALNALFDILFGFCSEIDEETHEVEPETHAEYNERIDKQMLRTFITHPCPAGCQSWNDCDESCK